MNAYRGHKLRYENAVEWHAHLNKEVTIIWQESSKSMDGNNAAAHVSAMRLPRWPASIPSPRPAPMADCVDQWAAAGQKNIFGTTVKVVEMQSEAGAAGTVHGSLAAGALTTTYTASQGLLLMIPNMYKIAGELLPCVFHVSARTVATHALNIFGDHSDVMACRQTGFAMLCRGQRAGGHGPGAVAHLAAIKGRVPFMNFFDGFRTSHEIQKVAVWDYDDLKEMVRHGRRGGVPQARPEPRAPHHARLPRERRHLLPAPRGLQQLLRRALPDVVEEYMGKVNEKLGTDYQLFNYYGAADADRVIIAMGSICDVAEEVIDYLNADGEKVGLIKVRLYRPFARGQAARRHPRHRQEDRRAGPHQGARRPGRAPVPGRGHRPGQRRPRPTSR